jgi:hypothetical protein
LFLCSRHPEVAGLATWSPAVELFAPEAKLLTGPWGRQIAGWIRGSDHNDWPFKKPIQARYWTNHQCWDGIIQFNQFLNHAMVPTTFQAIKCPVFVGYYYENEEQQDKLVSVAAMKRMLSQLGTPPEQRKEVNFPNAKDHVIGSQIVSQDWQGVERETAQFLSTIVQ